MPTSHDKNGQENVHPTELMSSVPKKVKATDTEDWLDDVMCTRVTQEDPASVDEANVSRYLGTKVKPGLTVFDLWTELELFFHDYLS